MISVSNLIKTYNDGTKAIDDISFSVNEGEFFGFLGPNGAGKTTTIKILTTASQKTKGNITITKNIFAYIDPVNFLIECNIFITILLDC